MRSEVYILKNSLSTRHNKITKDHTGAYIPINHKREIINGKNKLILESVIPKIIFVYATAEKI